MAYLGGKSKNSAHILDILNAPQYDGMDYIEPFVGYAHILRRVERKKTYSASDSSVLLCELLNGLKSGLEIPFISRERYYELKTKPENTFECAVACFTYSYSGRAWGGYCTASGSRTDYVAERCRYYLKLVGNSQFQRCGKVQCADYRKLKPKNALIYCDPPYVGTIGYPTASTFNSDEFWETMREWALPENNNIIYISEYRAPVDFELVASASKKCTLSSKATIRTENLYKINEE